MANTPDAFIAAGLFFAVAVLVLGIACVNVANILLSTAPARTRESAIRIALGAGRLRLVRQVLIESAIVSGAGTLAGLGLAVLAARFLSSFEIFENTPFKLHVHVDGRVVLFALGVGFVAGVLSGLIPAIRCSRSDLNSLLKSANVRAIGSGRARIRQALVILQMAVAVVVLVLCGFSLQQLRLLQQVDPGFRVDNVLRLQFTALAGGENSYRRPLEQVRSLPGVKMAAAAYPEPLGVGDEATTLTVQGSAPPPDSPADQITSSVVTDGYFETLNIPILRGRAFEARDDAPNRNVAIINEVMAEKYWKDRDAIGGKIQTLGPSLAGDKPVTLEVVGIVRNAKYRNLSEPPMPFLYLPMRDSSPVGVLFVVTDSDPATFAPARRREWQALSPNTADL